ncbi:MAG: hypothetical protein JWM86_617, partial [Thermoleophilia bacterium]|nr:hypothetical protein [Thermoleophilia bacterium]
VVAATRLAIGGLGAAHARAVLALGGVTSAIGAGVIAASDSQLGFAVGLVIAAIGTSVLFPTVLGVVSRSVEEARRGRATSLVTTVSYLGFLLGPAYVGAWAGARGLPAAMVAVAGLGVALALLTPVLMPHRR